MERTERKTKSVDEAIATAEAILPGVAAPDGEDDPRWQAIIEVGEYIGTDPEQVWQLVERWGGHEDQDLRSAIACCLLEHLLEHHFEQFFPRVECRVCSDMLFADMFLSCWTFGQSAASENAKQFHSLQNRARALQ